MSRSDSSRPWIAAEVTLALAIIALPWSFGGAAPYSLSLLAGLSSAAMAFWAAGAIRHHRRWVLHAVLLLPLGIALVSLLQLIPLPPALLRVVSPPAGELRDFALEPLGLTGWRPISLDVPATARALARMVALAGLLFVTLQLGRQQAVRERLCRVLALSGVAIALTGFGHLLAGSDALFGVHTFSSTLHLVTPFGNTNHLAAFLTLTGTVALGLALSAQSRDASVGWAAAAFACGVAVFLSFSRGGIATFVATWGLVSAAFLALKGGGIRKVVPWVLIAATVAFAGLLAFDQLAARAETVSTFDQLGKTKVELWPMLWRGVSASWPLGMGNGTFELGFSRWQTEQLDVTFTHPENIALQLAADVGVPLMIAGAVAAVWISRRLWAAVYTLPLERTVLLGVIGVVLHDVFDFALELQAVSTVSAIAIGLVASAAKNGARVTPSRREHGLLGAAVVAMLFGLWAGRDHHLDAERELVTAVRGQQPPAALRAVAVGLISRHPADWVLYATMASDSAVRADPREALAWLNRHAFLRPADPNAPVSAARALLRLKEPQQALAQLKRAWELGETSSISLGLAVAKREGLFERLLLDKPGHLKLLYTRAQLDLSPADAKAVLDAVELSGVGDGVRDEARLLLVQHDAEYGDPANALATWLELPAAERERRPEALLQVRLLEKLGRTDEAIEALKVLVARSPDDLESAYRLIDLLASRGRTSAAHEIVERVRPFVHAQASRSELFQRESALFVQEQRWGRALEALQTASRIEATRPDLHYRIADVLEHMGSLHSALDELRKGRVLDTAEGARARELQQKRLESLLATPQ